MRTSGFIISALLMLVSMSVLAQVDSVKAGKSKFVPTGLRVGFDLVSYGQAVKKNGIKALTQGEVRQWKFNADIDFHRYFLAFEYGHFERLWIDPNFLYNNNGTFYKIGPDVNFLHRDADHSALFVGFRYAKATYSDNITFGYTNGFWGDGAKYVENNSLQSSWLEFTTGMKVRIYKFIWTGYTARFKFKVNDSYPNNELAPYWIPGYGRAQEESRWGFEYWLMMRIPFRKYSEIEKKTK
jgi:hypothetical protein